MKTKILVMGLPGAGKTTLANKIADYLIADGYVVCSLNADEIRSMYDDWDFSVEGRLRQAYRMRSLADDSAADFVIADFIAPLRIMREIFNATYSVNMNTIKAGRFADTNSLFEPPYNANINVTSFDSEMWAIIIAEKSKMLHNKKV